ncbi:MAG: protein phosphatase 2C domain-containing protein [Pseudomonadota bacterium]
MRVKSEQMTKSHVTYQVASALYLGQRVNQEDAIATDFALGDTVGFVVLSDGMGGHNAGEVASKIVVTEVFTQLKFRSAPRHATDSHVRETLVHAAEIANACVGDVADETPEAQGMGATLVVPYFNGDQLHWISIGDSPLYLHRNGRLQQLNEDHSMGPHIDMMVRSGMMTESNGREHPDRNCLTSVLVGKDISKIDCPDRPTKLADGDIVIVASDGLQSIPHHALEQIIERHADDSSDSISKALLGEIKTRADPEQDNVCFAIVKFTKSLDAVNFCPTPDAMDDTIARQGAGINQNLSGITPRRRNRLHTSLARLLPTSPSTAK